MTQPPRLGLIVPSSNTTIERELPVVAPGADWVTTRVLQVETEDPERKVATVLAMRDELDAATE
ncbi:MAG: hypothetical protein ACTHKX_11545, partial [Pseudolysinimonas sp.]